MTAKEFIKQYGWSLFMMFNGFNPILIVIAWFLFLIWIITEAVK